LLDLNKPPRGSTGPGYTESQVTRHGKLGDFLIKTPLLYYALISPLLENYLTAYGDLASDYDSKAGFTTTKDFYGIFIVKSDEACDITISNTAGKTIVKSISIKN
jgi:hypothetical protein